MRPEQAWPWWRSWRAAALAAAVAVAVIGLGVSRLPTAPQAPTATPIPDTAKGRLVEKLETVSYPTPSVGWAMVTAGTYWEVLRSDDAGLRWKDVNPAGNASNGGLALAVMGPQTAAVVFLAYEYLRQSTFAITTDGGASWTAGILPNAASSGPDPIYAFGTRRIFAVLGSGEVVASRNGGSSWSQVRLPALSSGSCVPTSVWFSSRQSGWVTGSCTGVAALWHTSDGGQSWLPQVLSSAFPAGRPVEVLPPETSAGAIGPVPVLASRGSTQSLWVYSDASGSWRSPAALPLPAGRVLVSFASPAAGWVLLAPPAAKALGLFFATANGGANWSLRTTPIPADEITGFALLTAVKARVLGQSGRGQVIWSTASAGASASWKAAPLVTYRGTPPKVNGIRP